MIIGSIIWLSALLPRAGTIAWSVRKSYDAGVAAGKKEGYEKASDEYVMKFKELIENFTRLQEKWKCIKDESEANAEDKDKLIQEMLNYINDLEMQINELRKNEKKYSSQIRILEDYKGIILGSANSLMVV